MSNKIKIEWTDMTSNPIHLVKEDGSHGGQPKNLILDEKVLQSWVKMKKPHKIFVCSMTDMFGDWVGDAWLDKIFTIMAITPHRTYQVLTKRPERMLSYLDSFAYRFPDFIESVCADFGEKFYPEKCEYDSEGSAKSCEFLSFSTNLDFSLPCVLPNVWLGTSIENQKAADSRDLPLIKLNNLGWTTFYSVEPLLEKVTLNLNGISWVIVGGESGKGARPCHYEWILDVVEQCQMTNTPVFVKQLGTNYYQEGISIKVKGKGGDIHQLPSKLQVREFPKVLAVK